MCIITYHHHCWFYSGSFSIEIGAIFVFNGTRQQESKYLPRSYSLYLLRISQRIARDIAPCAGCCWRAPCSPCCCSPPSSPRTRSGSSRPTASAARRRPRPGAAAAAVAVVMLLLLLLLQSAGAEAGGESGHLQPGHGAALRGLPGDQAGGQRLPHPVP